MIVCGQDMFILRLHVGRVRRNGKCRLDDIGALLLGSISTNAGKQSPSAAPPNTVGEEVGEIDARRGNRLQLLLDR